VHLVYTRYTYNAETLGYNVCGLFLIEIFANTCPALKSYRRCRANSEMGKGPKVWQTLGRDGGLYVYV